MMVYRDRRRTVDARAWCERQADLEDATAGHDAAVTRLVEYGEIEAALCDRLMPDADDDRPEPRALRRAAVLIAHRLRCTWHRLPCPDDDLARILAQLPRAAKIDAAPLPVKVSEGFAYYGLYPETYLDAAERFAAANTPRPVLCIGLRTIGAALSAVVAAALEAAGWRVTAITLRPHGDPFARQPRITAALRAALQRLSDGYALIVDEGPGSSGSSFTGTAQMLRGCGFAAERICLFPSWNPDGARLVSPIARALWPRHAKWIGDFDRIWIHSHRLHPAPLQPFDATQWRDPFFAARTAPPIQPHHARRKFIGRAASPLLFKFTGLGPYGEPALQRAQALADAGFAPPVHGLRHGFLLHDLLPGRPLRRADGNRPLIERAARYLAFVARTFSAAAPTPAVELHAMLHRNARETLGDAGFARAYVPSVARFEEGAAVAVDGRMQPWEWIATDRGILKTDGVDHHADHFFPGCTDIAWDLAGFALEFALDGAGVDLLLRRFIRHGGDPGVRRRLTAYTAAYAAFRAGYAHMAAAATAGTAEAPRFRADYMRYRRALRRALFAPAP